MNTEDRGVTFHQDRFDVLFVLRTGTDCRSRERAEERFENVREIFSCLSKTRHLFRAIAIRNRFHIHGAHSRMIWSAQPR